MKPLLTMLVAAVAAASQMTQYTVTATADEHTDFSKLKTYEWEMGWTAIDRDAHRHFVVAINRELSALGLTEAAPGKSDVTVAYYSLRRDDVSLDWKVLTSKDSLPTFPVDTLIVVIRDAATRRELFSGRADAPIDLDPERLNAIIDEKVARIFELYPTRRTSQHTARR